MKDSTWERHGALGGVALDTVLVVAASVCGIARFALGCVRILGVSHLMWRSLRVGEAAIE